jgi:heterodisulfide reductase subunit A
MVVLATASIPRSDSANVRDVLGLESDETGFLQARDDEVAPVESAVPGVYLAGAVLGPKDIPETVAQASGAAAKVLARFRQRTLEAERVPA